MSDSAANDKLHEERQNLEVWREAITMALYISLSLLAVMTALPTQSVTDESNLALTVALTSIGLVLAHQVAFRMSARLVTQGSTIDPLANKLLSAQLIAGAAITLLAVLPILLFGNGAYRISIGVLLLFVMGVGYLVARSAPVSRLRAIIYVCGVAVVVIGVLVVKSLFHH